MAASAAGAARGAVPHMHHAASAGSRFTCALRNGKHKGDIRQEAYMSGEYMPSKERCKGLSGGL